MIKDITLGKYYSEESFVHRLDPRTKIRFILLYVVLFLLDRNLPFYVFMTFIFLIAAVMCKVPLPHMLKGSFGLYFALLLCSAINIFTTMGEAVVKLGGLTITREGLIKCGFVFWRLVTLILMSSVLMYTTTPTSIADGLEKCFHISGSIAMGITIALRFVSVLSEELFRIMKAQEARGARFKTGGIIGRLKNIKTVIIPLFQNAIDRAGNLGEALDSRCYKGGKGRTKLFPLRYSMLDGLAYMAMIIMLIVSVYLIWNY